MNLHIKQLLELAEDGNRWNHWGRWVQPTFSICFWPLWAKRDTYKAMHWPEVTGYTLQFDGHYIDLKDEYQRVINRLEEAFQKEEGGFLNSYVNVVEKTTSKHIALSKQLDLMNASLEKKLALFIDSTNQLVVPWIGALYLNVALDYVLSKELKKEGIKQIELSAHYEPKKQSMLVKQEMEAREFADYLKDANLLHILDEPSHKSIELLSKNHKALAERILKHLNEFEWVGTHHCWGEPLTRGRLFSQIKEMPPKHKKEDKLKNIPKKIEWLIKWQNEFAYWRQYCAETSDVGFYKARGILKEAADKLGLTYDEIIWLSDREILVGLKGGKTPSKKDLLEREKAYGYTETEEEEVIITGEHLHRLVRKLVPKVNTNVNEFVGIVGSKGMAIGNAFIAFKPQDAVEMKKGDILVAPQTTPDYIVLMKRAGAIVTDEGGITCHAAVVSRELGIPCVVGTKFATHVLKTGDRVEVDANSGLIRKL